MRKPKPNRNDPVAPRAYALDNCPLPFSRTTWFRWERQGTIPPLLRIGGKTLIPAETIDALVSGKIVPPPNAGRNKAPVRRDGTNDGGRSKRPKPETSVAAE